MATELLGSPIAKNITRCEGDTDDIVLHLTNPDGTDAAVIGWTAVLSIGNTDDTSLAPPKTYNGVGVAGGLIPIDMNGFDVAKGSYKYDVRITDTVTLDDPARVYFKGSFKVTPRIN